MDDPQREKLSRRRPELVIALALTIALGLASRRFPFLLPTLLGKYPGDALWAIMILVGIALLRPDIAPRKLALLALSICCLVELSQLYQAPWINSIRANRFGHLILGTTFSWPDIYAYAVGVILGYFLDVGVLSHRVNAPKPTT